ncbi:C40 family peptidase [Pseudonocardia xishanensis]|uniref:NlpC/P60 domain-containing protein n=1 Tax=Pseudonocardia xishanensis TaxID=630995 RepID=A0ABP8RTE0_9PSEU
MALREQSRSRSVKGRHRAAGPAAPVELPEQRTSHRWTSAESEEWAARRARWATWVPAPRRGGREASAPAVPWPVEVPAPRRAAEGTGRAPADDHRSGAPLAGVVPAGRPAGGMRAEAARRAAAGLAGARLATAALGRATGERHEPGVEEAPADPWGRRPLPVRYRPLPRRRRMTWVWVLVAALLVAAVGAVPSALRDPAIRTTATEDIGGAGGAGPVAPAPAEFTDQLPDGRAQVAIDAALSQVGVPYQWGGDGPGAGDQGFDCSGLTVFAYSAAGIGLPRTAHTQFVAGPHVPAEAALQPGDLVFYGTTSAVHHVGIYLGDGRMVNAPTYDQPVQVSYYRWRGDDYLGATRPAATGERRTGMLEVLPEPHPSTVWPRTFDAPRAPAPEGRIAPSPDLPPEEVTAAAALAALPTVPDPGAQAPRPGWRPTAWVLPAGEHQAADAATAAGVASPVGVVPADPVAGTAVPAGESPAATVPAGADPAGVTPARTTPAGTAVADPAPAERILGDVPAAGTSAAPGDLSTAATTPAPTDELVGTLLLPTGPVPVHAARLDADGVPVPPAPGTAALLDEGGAQLLLLPAADALPVGEGITLTVDGDDPRERTVVEAQSLTAAELAEHVRTLPEGEQQLAAPAPDGTWTVAELE